MATAKVPVAGWPEGEPVEDQVYVIGALDSPVAKIGVSSAPGKRLRQIQAMSPLRLEILWRGTGGYPLESRLHAHLRAYHSHGEWFDFQDLDPGQSYRPRSTKSGAGLPDVPQWCGLIPVQTAR
ncbi:MULTISPECIES: GIY-YIG nuclease family protein [unclassified Streptomyces]|uniref:GIY-YIG nuclease family protein n=1 Tax=unclassified Streptomyces TaxID=2593676 RepID=UPI003865CEF1